MVNKKVESIIGIPQTSINTSLAYGGSAFPAGRDANAEDRPEKSKHPVYHPLNVRYQFLAELGLQYEAPAVSQKPVLVKYADDSYNRAIILTGELRSNVQCWA